MNFFREVKTFVSVFILHQIFGIWRPLEVQAEFGCINSTKAFDKIHTICNYNFGGASGKITLYSDLNCKGESHTSLGFKKCESLWPYSDDPAVKFKSDQAMSMKNYGTCIVACDYFFCSTMFDVTKKNCTILHDCTNDTCYTNLEPWGLKNLISSYRPCETHERKLLKCNRQTIPKTGETKVTKKPIIRTNQTAKPIQKNQTEKPIQINQTEKPIRTNLAEKSSDVSQNNTGTNCNASNCEVQLHCHKYSYCERIDPTGNPDDHSGIMVTKACAPNYFAVGIDVVGAKPGNFVLAACLHWLKINETRQSEILLDPDCSYCDVIAMGDCTPEFKYRNELGILGPIEHCPSELIMDTSTKSCIEPCSSVGTLLTECKTNGKCKT